MTNLHSPKSSFRSLLVKLKAGLLKSGFYGGKATFKYISESMEATIKLVLIKIIIEITSKTLRALYFRHKLKFY
jgi:hypothetical protein